MWRAAHGDGEVGRRGAAMVKGRRGESVGFGDDLAIDFDAVNVGLSGLDSREGDGRSVRIFWVRAHDLAPVWRADCTAL